MFTWDYFRYLKLGSALVLLTALCQATPLYYLSTDQTGAQTQIDVTHTSTWLMTPNVDFDFGGGLLSMKAGQATTAPISLFLYQGTSAAGVLLGSVALTPADFCNGFSNCGQFEFHQFFFATPIHLVAGSTYFAALISAAPDMQSQAYFIKSSSYFISDASRNPIVPPPAIFGTPPPLAVPDPGSGWLLMAGFGLLCLFRRRPAKK